MARPGLFHDPELEQSVLAALLKFPVEIQRVVGMISYKHFYKVEHQWFWQQFMDYYRLEGNAPTYEGWEVWLRKPETGEDKEVELLMLFKDLSLREVGQASLNVWLEELEELKVRRELSEVLDSAVESYRLGHGRKALDVLENGLQKVRADTLWTPVKRMMIYRNTEQRLQEYLEVAASPESVKGAPYGLEGFDQMTNGIFKGELSLIFARTGRGKSRWMFNAGYNQVKKGYAVMYVTIEMPLAQVQRMYDSRFSQLSYTALKGGQLTPEQEEKYRQCLDIMQRKKDKFYIVDIPKGCTVSMLESEVRSFKRKHPLDVLIIDYMTLMKSESKTIDTWTRYGELSAELKQLARSEDIRILTAVQANREAAKLKDVEKSIGLEHIGLSDQIANNVDMALYLWREPEDDIMNQLRGLLLKKRDGPDYKSFFWYVNWDRNYIGERTIFTPSKSPVVV